MRKIDKYRIEELYHSIIFAATGLWYDIQALFWTTVAILTFEYENYWLLEHCRYEIGICRIHVGIYLYILEDLTPEEAEKNRYPHVELVVGYCLERVPELKAQLKEIRTRVFAWRKKRCMKNLLELEGELHQLKEKIRYGWHLERLTGAKPRL